MLRGRAYQLCLFFLYSSVYIHFGSKEIHPGKNLRLIYPHKKTNIELECCV